MKRAKRLEVQRRRATPMRALGMYWFDTTSESERLMWQGAHAIEIDGGTQVTLARWANGGIMMRIEEESKTLIATAALLAGCAGMTHSSPDPSSGD